MKMRKIALLLALVLCMSATLPVTARAAQLDPWVVETKKDITGEYRYCYDPDGNCLMEEWNRGGTYDVTYYTYGVNRVLSEKTVFRNGEYLEAVDYDSFGNMISRWECLGGKERTWVGVPEYDDYGRLVWHTTTGPYDENGALEENYEIKKIRYEYDDSVTLFFGRYEQDGNTANGPEPIEWEVIDTSGEYMMLISKYALDSRVYHSKNANISWQNSDMRAWLNGEFLETAFTDSEYYQLVGVGVENGDRDLVSLLSVGEALYYFPNEEDRICEATPYAVKQGAYVNNTTGGSWWLLRTPGTESQSVASVNSDGVMDEAGGKVTSKRGTVRPIMWVSKNTMAGNGTPTRKHEWLDSYENASTSPTYTMSRLLTYNEEGVLVYEQMEDNYVGAWQSSKRASYDAYGNPTDVIESMRRGEEDLLIYTYENSYDKAGRLTKQLKTWEGVQYSDEYQKELIQYRYDSKGNVTSRTKSYYEGSKWTTYATDTWTYDRYGNLLTFRADGTVEEEYTYAPLSQAQWS